MSQDLIKKTIKKLASDSWWIESEKKVIGKYGKMFNPSNLDKLTKEDFKSFLLIKNNLHWEGIHRQGNIITSDMLALRNFLKRVLNEDLPIVERLSTDFVEDGGYWVKGLGRAVITPILLVAYPKKYGVWNTRSENALKKLNLSPRFLPKDSFVEKYVKVNDVLLDLAQKYNISLWQLDGVLGEISGFDLLKPSVTFGEDQTEEDIVEEEAQEHGIVDLANFGMERHLEDFLIANWKKTRFGRKYDLIYKEGDLESQQYQTPVGPIDILARSKDKKEYLVIELKKGRTSDAVVGQALRYISWVKENLSDSKTVKGVVVVFEVDEKLQYALKGLKDITLYIYKVNFKLIKQQK